MSAETARYVKVGLARDIPQGRPEVFEVEDRHIAVYRLDDGYYAIEDICTHDGGPLAEGDVEGHEVVCPRHGARFDIKTGAVLCMPAVTPVESYPVRLHGDDLYIGLPD
ncbi:MAG TPA: non-heme iron oxygenase ferredoxin subunit [Candidatus Eisenbacteria bacterium]|nr:non-heme iron oxygenase ferredoxin subunit [Candidatus Eisenbacteria bacterium]